MIGELVSLRDSTKVVCKRAHHDDGAVKIGLQPFLVPLLTACSSFQNLSTDPLRLLSIRFKTWGLGVYYSQSSCARECDESFRLFVDYCQCTWEYNSISNFDRSAMVPSKAVDSAGSTIVEMQQQPITLASIRIWLWYYSVKPYKLDAPPAGWLASAA